MDVLMNKWIDLDNFTAPCNYFVLIEVKSENARCRWQTDRQWRQNFKETT